MVGVGAIVSCILAHFQLGDLTVLLLRTGKQIHCMLFILTIILSKFEIFDPTNLNGPITLRS